MQGKRGHIAR